MTEDQKGRTAQRNYIASHQHIAPDNYFIDDDDSDSSNESGGTADDAASTEEIEKQAPIKYPHKQGVPLAYKGNSESSS